MSAEADGWVRRFSPLVGGGFSVHQAIADSANDQHGYEFWMRHRKLALKARVSRATVQRALDALIAHDPPLLAKLGEGQNGLVRYRLLMPDMPLVYDSTAPGGVPHHEAPDDDQGASPRDRGVPHGDTGGASPRGTVTQEELKMEPKLLGANAPSGDELAKLTPAKSPAQPIAAAEWERRRDAGEQQALGGFVAFRTRVHEALVAGHTPEAIAEVLPSMTTFTRGSFEHALSGGRRAKPRQAIDTDRDAAGGEIVL